MLYIIIKYICSFFCHLTGKITYVNLNNIKQKKTFLIIANHKSNLDPILIGIGISHQLIFLSKDSLFKNIIFKWFFNKINVIPVKKNSDIKNTIKKILFLINMKRTIVLFPEGTRNKTNQLILPFKNGASLIAIKSQIPIIPVAISGSNKLFGEKKIIFGKHIIPPIENTRKNRNLLTKIFENEIIKLLEK